MLCREHQLPCGLLLQYTTEEMKEETGNPDFEYEISCDQMCGQGPLYNERNNYSGNQEEFDTVDGKTKTKVLSAHFLTRIQTLPTKQIPLIKLQQQCRSRN